MNNAQLPILDYRRLKQHAAFDHEGPSSSGSSSWRSIRKLQHTAKSVQLHMEALPTLLLLLKQPFEAIAILEAT
ncbi:conserved hypothetical protein [Ricinus communis]|uniref:Uncharacterized protein n=1 Tax=Ricinus communis TaxID=3988 RepID=B9SCT4_RICCO|nr:conserved hypothetical protein [Ricinus communis]